MNSRKFSFWYVVLYLCLLIGSLVGLAVTVEPLHASADIVYRQLSIADSYAFYGENLDIVYYSTTGYKHAVLTKQRDSLSYCRAGSEINGLNIPSWLSTSDLKYCQYEVTLSDYSYDPSYLGVSISPNVHFSDCNGLRFCAAAYIGNSNTVSAAAYDSSFISVYGHSDLRFENAIYADNDIFPYWRIGRSASVTGNRVLPVWCDYTSDTLSDVSLLKIGFNGARLNNGNITIYLSCPLVNDTAYGGTGIVTGTSTPTTQTGVNGDINVNVDVDMEETNGLLDSILDGISGLVEGVAGIFIPEDGILESFENDLAELLQDTFGGVESDMLINVIEDLLTHGATESVTFPAINVPGTNFHINSYSVPLKPASTQLHSFYDAIALALDLVATIAVLNQIFDKMKAVVVGEKVVEVENVD